MMDRAKRDELRALCDATELPWRAVDVTDGGTVLGRGTAILRPHSRWLVRRVAEIDMGDGEECDTSHAALIVGAVNAVTPLCDAADAADARIGALETAIRTETERQRKALSFAESAGNSGAVACREAAIEALDIVAAALVGGARTAVSRDGP
jgi:hypothetical protein